MNLIRKLKINNITEIKFTKEELEAIQLFENNKIFIFDYINNTSFYICFNIKQEFIFKISKIDYKNNDYKIYCNFFNKLSDIYSFNIREMLFSFFMKKYMKKYNLEFGISLFDIFNETGKDKLAFKELKELIK